MMKSNYWHISITDIYASFNRYQLVGTLGWQDILQRYRRSRLGPFWITIAMAVMIGAIGFVFGQIFQTNMGEFFPHLAVGLIFWGFIVTTLNESCNGFIEAEGIIKQLPIPLFVHILRVIWRNDIVLLHNLVILPLVFLIIGKGIGWIALLSFVGFILVLLNLMWISLLVSILSTRYRDFPQIVASALQVMFYLTPIMWMPAMLPEWVKGYLLGYNPFYHLLELVRAPLLGSPPSALSWIFCLVMLCVGWFTVLLVYGRVKLRIAYWL
jgi:ABC-type polysaccharide/polyol phosphate export permease